MSRKRTITKEKHPPYNGLKAFLKLHGIKQKEVAEFIGVTNSTLSEKINGKLDFTFQEVLKICNKYRSLGCQVSVFLADTVSQTKL